MDQQAEILCWIDDLCLTEILDPSLGFNTHRTRLIFVKGHFVRLIYNKAKDLQYILWFYVIRC